MHKRPIPRVSTTIGAWLNIFQVSYDFWLHKFFLFVSLQVYQLYIILWRVQELTTVGQSCSINFYVIVFLMLGSIPFQFLVVTSICTNCALLVWLYDQEGKWKIEPGLAAILVMEHVLLLIKFGFSRFVPEVILNCSCEPCLTSRPVIRTYNCWKQRCESSYVSIFSFLAGTCLGTGKPCEERNRGREHVLQTAFEEHFWRREGSWC